MAEDELAGADLVLDDGTPVIVKRGIGPRAAALRAEGERLQRAAHPGVVSVVRSDGDDARWELHLAHAGRPVSLLRPASAEQVAQVVAATAAIVADLHAQGIVHGRLAPAHVLVGPEGRVRLCGFGSRARGEPADDVAALGALLVELLGDREELEPLPERRWHRRRAWSGVTRRSLLTIADQATAEPASRRPTARRLAASIAAAVPSVRPVAAVTEGHHRSAIEDAGGIGPVVRPRPRVGTRHRRSAARSLVGALTGLVVVGIAILRLGSTVDPGRPPAPCVRLVAAPPSGQAPCATSVAVEGNQVQVGTSRFEVGRPGDVVTLGDWDCDGGATPAVLRPTTGEVFVFPAWAGDADVRVPARARVAGAVRLLAAVDPGHPGCSVLVAEQADGARVELSTGSGA
jgi:hypothetical protein